jgi:hypothetical protein
MIGNHVLIGNIEASGPRLRQLVVQVLFLSRDAGIKECGHSIGSQCSQAYVHRVDVHNTKVNLVNMV